VNTDKLKLWSFLAWPAVGAVLLGLFILLKWGGDRRSSVGLISSIGLPLLYVAFLNRDGPGTICSSDGNGGQQCMDEWSPMDSMAVASDWYGAPRNRNSTLRAGGSSEISSSFMKSVG
jgi:hypothetical protein